MALAEAERRLVLSVIGLVPLESAPPHIKARVTRALRVVQRDQPKRRRGRKRFEVPESQGRIELQFRCLPPTIKRARRKRWAKYPYEMVEEARRLRIVKGWTYRDIAETLNHRHGTSVNWITVRDWTSQFYRVTG